MGRILTCLTLMTVFGICSIHGYKPETGIVRHALLKRNKQFAECYERGDLTCVTDLFTDDAELFDIASGIATKNEDLWKKFLSLKGSIQRWVFHSSEVLCDGSNRAVWRGNSTGYRRDGTLVGRVKDIQVFRKEKRENEQTANWYIEAYFFSTTHISLLDQLQGKLIEFSAYLKAKDDVASFYTDDCTVMPDQSPEMHGKQEVTNYWYGKCVSSPCEFEINKHDLKAVDIGANSGVLIGTINVDGSPQGICLVFKNVNLVWLIHHHMWSLFVRTEGQ